MHIQSIDLQGFKSFKKCHVEFSPHVNAIIGPNGSGKSNIIDAIMFALGETSLSKMRTDKLSGLVNSSSKNASVILTLADSDGEKTYKISRLVNRQGKGQAYIDGRPVTLKELRDFLFHHGLGNARSCIIPQGEILRIVKMKPRERKSYLDELADTVVYDARRTEAIKELEAVGRRINEVNLLLGEKLKLLEELRKEKEQAEKYKGMETRLRNVRGTLLKRQLEQLNKTIEAQSARMDALLREYRLSEKELEELEEKIASLEKERTTLDEKLVSVRERDSLFKKAEEKKAEIKIMEAELESIKERRKSIQEELEEIDKELQEKISKIEEMGDVGPQQKMEEIEELRELASVESEAESVERRLEELHSFMSDYEAKKAKLESLETLALELSEEKDFSSELEALNRKTRELFEEEKSLNKSLYDLDLKLTELREKLGAMKERASSSQMALRMLVDELRDSGKIEGIYGRVVDLIDFDPGLAEAIDAAGGGRLSYFVVEDIEVARKVIEVLKRNKVGRASFIPLKDLNAPQIRRGNHPLIIDMINFNPNFEKAIHYVFGSTVLASDFEEAKRIRAEAERVVTTSGELIERSGVVTGGKARKQGLAASKSVDDLQREMDSLRGEKEALLRRLNDLRQEIADVRAQKKLIEEKEKEAERNKEAMERARKLEAEKEALKKYIGEKEALYSAAQDEVKQLRGRREELKAKRKQLELLVREKSAEVASKEARVKALMEQKAELKKDVLKLSKKKEELEQELSSLSGKERSLRDKRMITEASVTQMEEELKDRYKEMQEIMERIKEIERELQLLGGKKAELMKSMNSNEKSRNSIEVSLAATKERKNALKEELARIHEFEEVETPTPKLESELLELERKLSSMGNINFAASEAYERINSEVGEVKDRIEKLKNEREAVLNMIKEIDEQKKEAFLKAFNLLNEKFKEMFNYLEGFGKGELILVNGNDPDKAELKIKVEQNGRDVFLESLAGGEKTLVSLFFLYALNAVKPSPFYIFDEVDAALDKLNCERYVEFVRNLSKNSQFILISHRDPVIGKADVVLGVSKRAGSSQVVGVKMPTKASKASPPTQN